MTSSGYWVDGVQLVNVGGELCEACEQRPGVGRSLNGHVICKRCAGWHAREAEEMAAEVEASRQRRAYRQQVDSIAIREITARLNDLPERERTRRASVSRVAKENNYRKAGATATRFNCGHPRVRENLDMRPGGKSACRTCRRERDKLRVRRVG